MARWPYWLAFASLALSSCNDSTKPTRDAGDPAARRGAALSYDAARRQLLLFGGSNAGVAKNDLWAWGGSRWSPLFEGGPSPREASALVYDSTRRRVVLFGGERANGASIEPLGDTWEWDGAAWALAANDGPGPRRSPGVCFDSTRSATVLYGGIGPAGESLTDTWEWDGLHWTRLAVLGAGDHRHCELQLEVASRSLRLLCADLSSGVGEGPYAQDVWRWDGSRWDSVGVAPALHLERHWLTLPGGSDALIFDGGDGKTYLRNAGAWSESPAAGPGVRSGFSLALDSDRGRVLLFGGTGASGSLDDLWEWDGGAWSLVR